MKLPQFAFEIGRHLKGLAPGQRLLVACSGGVDSIALVDVLLRLRGRVGFELVVAHVHHGGANPERDRALEFVRDLAHERGVLFFERRASTELKGEEALRDFRKRALDEMVLESSSSIIVLGHHADDLFETRLLRLIRGTGPAGLRAMRARTKRVLRPFLSSNRAQIEAYAQSQNLKWVEDSSNRDHAYLRNWVRHEWLPALEQKRSGSRVAFSRSLDLLCEAVPTPRKPARVQSRQSFHELGPLKKRALIASIARSRGIRDFGASKIIEVLKRLDRLEITRQKRARFIVGGIEWQITPDQIASRVLNSDADAALHR